MSGWAAWRERTFGTPYEVWHDGVDPNRLRDLDADARAEVEALLPEGIAGGDWLAALAVRELGLAHLVPALVTRAEAGAAGRFVVEAARAARALGTEAGPVTGLALAALRTEGWTGRIDVAIGLRHLGGAEVIGALVDRVGADDDYLVRYHSAESLLRIGGISPATIVDHPGVFADLAAGDDRVPSSEDRDRHRRAAAALAGLLGR